MKIIKANDGPLTNFELLDYLRSRGASKEVAVTVTPSEYKVFEYLVETAACDQTRERVTDFVQKVKTYNLAKAEVLNIINIRPPLPVGIFTIVENCDTRLGEAAAEELAEMVSETLPPPPAQPEIQDADQPEGAIADGDPQPIADPDGEAAKAGAGGAVDGGDDMVEDGNLGDAS
ncbi:uncharacterized protein LOC116208891 [Punica granatum]|uniref:Uncharacterized protein LOC116208891 n=2 Tax=Punica granatum TaxID=22663 RepID=A0A6P8DV89_PUNGR|nr:uncharacterized protein LOC116208891 [Punica granatum]XP_031398319.1 uncharacterized protein LOC116208891 [Punica granatum]PKI71885.1 hypothetical protein CRG98_007744 [Punica granatum]